VGVIGSDGSGDWQPFAKVTCAERLTAQLADKDVVGFGADRGVRSKGAQPDIDVPPPTTSMAMPIRVPTR
jgi:hypothetical protein